MAFEVTLENARGLWAEWNIKGFVILSLSLQAFLTLFSPLRKSTSNSIVCSLIWMAYLSADWVAAFLVGHIATTQGDVSTHHGELLAFWAAFLLVHLGGPGTITALNLEDNSLWVRHLFSLILQASTICYIFVRVMSINSNILGPTILVFISGIIKYSERTAALYLASTSKLKESMLKDSLKLRNAHPKKPYDFREGDLGDDVVIVKHAHHLYEVSKGMIVELIISFDEEHKIREFFQNMNSEDALKIISTELNFFYEVLYTKANVSNSSLGLLFRCLSLGTITAALGWFLRLNKDMYSKFDAKLSYALLLGAVALDGIGLLMILFSNWPVPKIASFGRASTAGSRIKSCFTIQRPPNWVLHGGIFTREGLRHSLAETLVFCRRWSESISQYSLMSNALRRPSDGIYKDKNYYRICSAICHIIILVLSGFVTLVIVFISFPLILLQFACKLIFGYIPFSSYVNYKTLIMGLPDKLGLQEVLDYFRYVSKEPISRELWDFIYVELKNKSNLAQNNPQLASKIIGAKGDFILRDDNDFKENYKEMLHIIEGLDFDEVVLLWHIVTELLYSYDSFHQGHRSQLVEEDQIFGKILSNYMTYLLIKKSTMMSTVAGAGQIRYRDALTDTYAVVTKLFGDNRNTTVLPETETDLRWASRLFLDCLSSACFCFFCCCCQLFGNWLSTTTVLHAYSEKVNTVSTHVLDNTSSTDKQFAANLDKSKSVWPHACRLAKALKCIEKQKRWRMIAKVWVEVLSYAASHCKGEAHAQALGHGGELITIVWLLMTHLGLSQRQKIEIVVADGAAEMMPVSDH